MMAFLLGFHDGLSDNEYSLPSDDYLREHIRAYLNGELDETGTTEPGKAQARAGFNPNTLRGFKATSDLGKPVHSPYQISRTLAHDLGIGNYIGTRKMNNMPRGVAGYYQTHAKYDRVHHSVQEQSSKAGHAI